MQKTNKRKNRRNVGSAVTQALLEKQKNRHNKCSQGRDHNLDYRQAHGKERSGVGSVALYLTRWCQLQESTLYSVSCPSQTEVKEDAVHHHGRREDNGRAWILLFLGPGEIWCCYFDLGGVFCSHDGHGGPGGHFCWLTGGGHG